jgi:hypothetical protein
VQRTFLLLVLVVLVPAMNLRMICVDHAGAASAASAEADCTDLCPRQGRAPEPSSERCLLVPGGCSAVSALLVALPVPSPAALAAPAATFVTASREADLYVAPCPSRLNPPPRAA